MILAEAGLVDGQSAAHHGLRLGIQRGGVEEAGQLVGCKRYFSAFSLVGSPEFEGLRIGSAHSPFLPQPDPITHEFVLIACLDEQEEGDVQQMSGQAFAVIGLAQLPGEFLRLARAGQLTLEIIGQDMVGLLLLFGSGDQFGIGRLAQEVMPECPQAAALHQMRLHRQQERTPGLAVHRPAFVG